MNPLGNSQADSKNLHIMKHLDGPKFGTIGTGTDLISRYNIQNLARHSLHSVAEPVSF